MGTLRSLADDLRARSDAELAALLEARPDLARPAPADVTALAARATTRASLHRALDGLDLAHLQALEAVVVASPCDAAQVAALLATDARRAAELLDRLVLLALCWRSPEGVRATRAVAQVLGEGDDGRAGDTGPGPYGAGATTFGPAGLGPPGPDVPQGADLDAALAAVEGPARHLLDALTWGPPTGALSRTGPMAAAGTALVEAGLLVRVDDDHVVLPRQVALALRTGRLHRHPAVDAPRVATTHVAQEVVDAAAGGRAGDLVVLVTEIVDRWGVRPPRVLRSGGLAVRDLHRLAAHLEIHEAETAWLLETVHAAGLVAVDDGGRRGDEPSWVPTTDADGWLLADAGDRWARLAAAWWAMSAAPSLVGSGDGGRVNVLTTATSYPPARRRRHDTLAALASLPPGAVADAEQLGELLRWRHPVRAARAGGDPAVGPEVALREAEWAGVTGRNALSTPGRLLLGGSSDTSAQERLEAAARAMEPLVPPAVEHVLLQADLTAVAPGRLDGAARTLLHLVSDVESRGGASVHRFTDTSVRRALDAGWSADRLLSELAAVSRTGVPQPLDYLVRDVARRHGQATVGACAAYLRSDDPALLDRVEHDRTLSVLQWRRVAPTVLVSPVPAPTVVDLLREEQYGPVVEGAGGGAELVPQTARRVQRRAVAPVRVAGVDRQVATAVVGLMRRGEGATAAGADDLATDPVVIAATLREAAAEGGACWIGYADDVGGVATHLVRPLGLEAGRVRAAVGDGDVVRSFGLHRVTGVRPAG